MRENLSSTELLKYPGKARRDSKTGHEFFLLPESRMDASSLHIYFIGQK